MICLREVLLEVLGGELAGAVAEAEKPLLQELRNVIVLELHHLELLIVHQMPFMRRDSVPVDNLLQDKPALDRFHKPFV